MGPRKRRSGGEDKSSRELSRESRSDGEPPAQGNKLLKKVLIRIVFCTLMILTVYWSSKKDTERVFASQKERVKSRFQEVPCSKEYKEEISKYKDCVPSHCGRLLTDIIVSEIEAGHLLQIAKRGLAFGGSGGGASILDLHSGALSQGNSFINIYKKMKSVGTNLFTEQDFQIYRNVRNKIQQMIAFGFGIQVNKIYLTHPTFFSEMTSRAAKTKHDEYWHIHVDKETYPSFHYTSLLYLTNYEEDFIGGRFVFVEKNQNVTVEPRVGRVSAFTSGAENPHFVEKVTSGTRYALTVSFTCDPRQQIKDPSIDKIS